uniref:GAF domain-containing protein n=1 Tax=Eiseniibacteriota bacterium TaxID=2212470 RepID=A0A832I1E3_UNCEI
MTDATRSETPPAPRPDSAAAAAREPAAGGGPAEVALRAFSALGVSGGEAVLSGTHLDDLLRTASRHCRRLVDAERVRIWIARRGGRRLVAREAAEDRPPAEYRLRRGEGVAGWVLTRGQALRLAPGEPRPELRGEVEPFEAVLALPLFRRGEAFGVIECLDKRGGGAFTDADADHLEAAAEHVAFALDNALLYRETERRALEKEALLEVSKTLAEALDLDEVLSALFEALRQVVDFDAAAVYLVDRRTHVLELVSALGYPEGADEAFALQLGQGIAGWVAKTGEPVIVPDVSRDARYVAARPSTRSELAAPLLLKGRTIGVFNLESDLDDAYHEGHLELVTAFASQAAIAIERARLTDELLERRRIEKELAIAREIQASFLPERAPRVPGFDLAGTTIPHDEVGGDYFDFIEIGEHRLGLAIADVSGKGIPAALIMAGFRMSLLAEIRNEFAIRAVMRKVNSLLHESLERDRFVTAFYGVLDWKSGMLTFSNGGHNPPVLLRADGGAESLAEGGVALGVLPDATYDDRPVALRPGDVLFLYTDGVSEAESPDGEQFGRTRIERTLRALAGESAEAIAQGVVRAVLEWTGERGQNDDLTLMVVKATSEAGPGVP